VFRLAERTPQKRPGEGAGDEGILMVRLPQKRNREMFGVAELMMGANHIRVRCIDGVTRLGRIKGKIKKKVWDPGGGYPHRRAVVVPGREAR
jgi:hypothetical protein